jgi:NAD-dependent dihydropyrimidine dehydrogenase PreA subunit
MHNQTSEPLCPTIALFRCPDRLADAGKRRTEETVIAELQRKCAGRILLCPHVYDLTDTAAVWSRLPPSDTPVIAVSWLYPRALRWILEARLERHGGAGHILCLQFPQGQPDAGWWGRLGTLAAPCAGTGELEDLSDCAVPARRWYPVIDYDRCRACGDCFEFCLFGTYTRTGDGGIVVTNPDNCKTGCPACARACPTQAIVFPECDDATIAGAASPPAAPPEPEPEATDGTTDELDDLIDALDHLDL